ncbi:MAG: DNA polymerase III subunit beta [Omnitrophica WOR_2 bacterium GWA2_47_8]|nr:MAG: DNA polymerase III subunit beta [Omnitrophica WOR_2 bacterium GWA2_47_8]
MKIKMSKDELMIGIQTVQNVVSVKTTLPILSNILVETVKNDQLKLNSTDLDLGISCGIAVDVLEEGAITIPAKRFSDIVREMPSGDIVISTKKNNQIDIEGNRCRFKLIGLPKDEFPKFPEFKDKEVITLDQEVLKEMIRMTSFAVSHEESRYVLNGILFEIADDSLSLVASDGRRLAKITKKLDSPIKKEAAVIIPLKAIQEINRNLKDEGELSLVVSTNQALFDINGVLIATRIIEGEYPNYNQVIPKPIQQKVRITTQDILDAVKRAHLLSTPDFQAVKLEVFKDKMVVSKITPEIGESREEIAIEYGGPELMVGVNPQFLLDVLKNINELTIEFELLGADKQLVMRLKDYIYVAMPMRL